MKNSVRFNLTVTNLQHLFINRKYDLIVGGISPGDVNFEKFEASAPYQQDDITWCVSYARLIPRWMNLLYIADFLTIFIAIGGVAIIIALVYLLYAFEDRPADLIFCIILCYQTITQFPTMSYLKRTSNKFLFSMMLLLGFWLSTIFGAYVIVFMGQDLYATQIATIHDIIEENYRLAGNPNVLDHFKVKNVVRIVLLSSDFTVQPFIFISLYQFTPEQIHNFETCTDIDECLQRLQDDHQLAVATSRLHVKTLPMHDNIYCFDRFENIYDYSSVIMIRNNFPLKSRFVNVLDMIIAAGFIAKWEKDFLLHSNHTRVLVFEDRSISMADLGVIVLYISLLMFLSLVAFFAEFVIYYQNRSGENAERNSYINSFWDFLDKAICGRRYFFLLGQTDFITDIIFGIINWMQNVVFYWVAVIRRIVERVWNTVVVPGIYFSVFLFVFLNIIAVVVWILMKYYVV